MQLKYTLLSKNKKLKGTMLQVCNNERHLDILQYKAGGSLLYSRKKGMYSEDHDRQVTRMRNFLKLANDNGTDLIIAPEASVPLEIIEEIINEKSLRPERGKLWCLGVEGIAKEKYNQLVDKWKNNKKIVFVHSEIANLRKHVNTAFYFFLNSKDELAVVVQVKTGAMRDIFFEHEQDDLSLGEEIFIFDLNGNEKAKNVLATLICADILNVNATEFCANFHGKYPLILNIQMNSKPFHGKIIDFRETFFEDQRIRKGQMIVANWGRGTTIREKASTVEPPGNNDSGSVIYLSLSHNHGEDRPESLLQKSKFVCEGIGEAQKSGLEYFLTTHYELWKLQEDIEIAKYRLKKGYSDISGSEPTNRQYFPYIVGKYTYGAADELEENKGLTCDCSEMKTLLDCVKDRASDEIKICAGQSCQKCIRFYVDALIGLCLDEGILDEFMIRGDKSHRTVQALYRGSEAVDKIEKIRKLINGMETIAFPERFGLFNENRDFYFKIDQDTALRGGNNIYNLEVNCEKPKRHILVAYLGDIDFAGVKERYNNIKERIHEERQDDILLYYTDSKGLQVYDEPYTQESISPHNHDFSMDIESFKS